MYPSSSMVLSVVSFVACGGVFCNNSYISARVFHEHAPKRFRLTFVMCALTNRGDDVE